MRKTLIFSLLLVPICFYFVITGVSAQDVNDSTSEPDLVDEPVVEENVSPSQYDAKYSDYSRAIEDYRRAHDAYRLTRAQYLRSKTQKAKTDAKESTIKMLVSRDEVAISYLELLKTKLNETEGVGDARYDGLAFKIDEELFWYNQHKSRITSAGSLEDLVEDSDDVKKRQKDTERLYYEALSNISNGKVTHYKDRVSENMGILREKVDEIRIDERVGYSFSNRKMQILDRWLFETENLLVRTQDKQFEADDEINDLLQKQYIANRANVYNNVLEVLSEGKQFLKEASSYLIEVIKEIKIAEY